MRAYARRGVRGKDSFTFFEETAKIPEEVRNLWHRKKSGWTTDVRELCQDMIRRSHSCRFGGDVQKNRKSGDEKREHQGKWFDTMQLRRQQTGGVDP